MDVLEASTVATGETLLEKLGVHMQWLLIQRSLPDCKAATGDVVEEPVLVGSLELLSVPRVLQLLMCELELSKVYFVPARALNSFSTFELPLVQSVPAPCTPGAENQALRREVGSTGHYSSGRFDCWGSNSFRLVMLRPPDWVPPNNQSVERVLLCNLLSCSEIL